MAERPGFTRRSLLAALGAIATGGAIGRVIHKHSRNPDAEQNLRPVAQTSGGDRVTLSPTPRIVTERDAETTYPLVTYNNRTGEYDVTMPVNVRFALTGSACDLSDVEAVVDFDDGWTQIVAAIGEVWPTKDAKPPEVWDNEAHRLVPPARNYRKPIDPFGPLLGYHLYLWPVGSEGELVGVVGQAHIDVGNVTDHIGSRFDAAAAVVSSAYARAGWRVVDTAIDYGVTDGRLDFWGPTGDRLLLPPRTSSVA